MDVNENPPPLTLADIRASILNFADVADHCVITEVVNAPAAMRTWASMLADIETSHAALQAERDALEKDKQHYMDEAAKWLDTAANNLQAYRCSEAKCLRLREEADRFGVVIRTPDFRWNGRKWPMLDHDELRAAIDHAMKEQVKA